LRQHLSHGDFPGAVRTAVGAEPSGSTGQFFALDTALQSEIARLRAMQFDSTTVAYRSLSLLPTVGTALGVACGFAVAFGIWPRLNEFHC
jgi:hypothetical protein